MPLYVAVVDRESVLYRSHRPKGDYSAFIGDDRHDVVQRTLAARNEWGRTVYRVLVGELTGEVREPVAYEVVPL